MVAQLPSNRLHRADRVLVHHTRKTARASMRPCSAIPQPLNLAWQRLRQQHSTSHRQCCCQAGAESAISTTDPAILIVDHGSRKASSNEMLDKFAELYRQVSGRKRVFIAHMELAQPSIGDAIQQLAQQGEQEVVVVPYFLSPGRHITQDIPALVDTARQANPDITCSIADPIGIDPLMAEIIEQRVQQQLSNAQ